MEIRFISSLTSEDEDRVAPALLKAVATLLDELSITYTLRIETTGAKVLQHTHPAVERRASRPATAASAIGAAFGRFSGDARQSD